MLLRCWNGVVDQVSEAITVNRNSGVRYPDMYIGFYDEMGPMDVLQKKRWLASTINPKTGEFHTLTELKAAGVISDAELKFFQGPLPRRELTSMTRPQSVQTTLISQREYILSQILFLLTQSNLKAPLRES